MRIYRPVEIVKQGLCTSKCFSLALLRNLSVYCSIPHPVIDELKAPP